MYNGPSDGKRFLLIALGAVWLMAFVYAFLAFASAPNTTEDAQAATKPQIYLGWQGVAGVVAFAVYGVGRAWEPGSATRRLSGVPILLAFLQAIAIIGIYLWGRTS